MAARKQKVSLEKMSVNELKAELSIVEAQFTPDKEWLVSSKRDSAVTLCKLLSAELARRQAKPKSGVRAKLRRFFRRRL